MLPTAPFGRTGHESTRVIFGAAAQTQPAPAKSEMPGDTPPPKKGAMEPIPEKYNNKSKLTAEVTKDGPNKFDFELTDK